MIILTEEAMNLIEIYSRNEMRKLKQICYPIIIRLGGISESDYDDFYSIANRTLLFAAKDFDCSQNDCFEAFLKDCLSRKFKTEMTRRNRGRRVPAKCIDSIDQPLSSDGDLSIGDLIKDGFDLDSEIEELALEENVIRFLDSLTPKQKKIAMLIIKGYEPSDIKVILNMSDAKFNSCMERMGTFDKRILLSI